MRTDPSNHCDNMTVEQEKAQQLDAMKSAQQPQYANAAMAVSNRQSARSVLEQRYERLLQEANGIHALLRALPLDMSHHAEEALWRLAIEHR